MKHLFVPYEIALKLKELGFDEPCLYTVILEDGVRPVYNGHQMEWIDWNNFIPTTNTSVGKCYTSAPLYQQVIDWFRERGIRVYEVYNANTWSVTEQVKTDEFIHHGWTYTLDEAINQALKLIP